MSTVSVTPLVKVVDQIVDDAGVETRGHDRLMEAADLLADGAGITPAANIAAVAVPFADLTAAANAHNALLAALKAAGLMVADA